MKLGEYNENLYKKLMNIEKFKPKEEGKKFNKKEDLKVKEFFSIFEKYSDRYSAENLSKLKEYIKK